MTTHLRAAAIALIASSTAYGAPDGFETIVKPFVKQNCVACHNAKTLSGDLDLDRFLSLTGPAALKERERWEKVIARLKSGTMPPKGIPNPPRTAWQP